LSYLAEVVGFRHSLILIISREVSNLGPYCTVVLFDDLPAVSNRAGRLMERVSSIPWLSAQPTVHLGYSEMAAGAFFPHPNHPKTRETNLRLSSMAFDRKARG